MGRFGNGEVLEWGSLGMGRFGNTGHRGEGERWGMGVAGNAPSLHDFPVYAGCGRGGGGDLGHTQGESRLPAPLPSPSHEVSWRHGEKAGGRGWGDPGAFRGDGETGDPGVPGTWSPESVGKAAALVVLREFFFFLHPSSQTELPKAKSERGRRRKLGKEPVRMYVCVCVCVCLQ